MTEEEKELALHCLKASSHYYSERCDGCIKYSACNHMWSDDVTESIIKALEQVPTEIDEIPKDYVYDTETKDFVVYRHKYSGDEIHIKKLTPIYTLGVISKQELYEALYERFHDEDSPNNITEVTLGSVRNFVKNFPCVTPTQGTCKDCSIKKLDKAESEEVGAEKYFCPVVGNYVDETPTFYCASFEK